MGVGCVLGVLDACWDELYQPGFWRLLRYCTGQVCMPDFWYLIEPRRSSLALVSNENRNQEPGFLFRLEDPIFWLIHTSKQE